jgi:hypothetical protein
MGQTTIRPSHHAHIQQLSLTAAAACFLMFAGCAKVGDSCTSDIQCGTGICLDGVCASSCDGPEACEDGLACIAYTTRGPDGGVVGGGFACGRPRIAIGSSCGSASECVSGAGCVEGTCRAHCDPFNGSVCAANQVCSLQSGGESYCVPFP